VPDWGTSYAHCLQLGERAQVCVDTGHHAALGQPAQDDLMPKAQELEHERDVLVADHPRDFAGWIDRLLEDDELCARLGANGRRTVERHYDWKAIGDRLDAALGKALERR